MKNVLLCIPNLASGGAEKFVVDLSENLNKDKYNVAVAVTRQNLDTVYKRTLEKKGIPIVDLSGDNYLTMLKKQICFFKRTKIEIVHANIGSILHIMFACMVMKIPKRIYTVHNESKLLYHNNKVKKNIYKLAFSFFKFTPVAICSSIKESLIQDMQLSSLNIPVVNNGVDTIRFNLPEKHEETNKIKIISVGTLYWIKNQKLSIKLVCDLRRKGYNISLDIIGDGEDREKLECMIRDNKAEKYIVLHGRKNHVEKYLKQSDIYISSSITEGLPLSILEAMACGLPIVATDVGGVRDIVFDSVNGYIVQGDNIDTFEKALEDLILSKETRSKFGENSRMIAEKWSIQSCVRGYEELYD